MVRSRTTYHHGHLREELLRHAASAIADEGAAALSLRAVARRAGVSHAAASHHFGDKAGLLTALAIEGLDGLAAALDEAAPRGFLEVGVAYVRYAVDHPGHTAVMFDAQLVNADDPALLAAREAAGRALNAGAPEVAAHGADPRTVAVAAWALVHGLVGLIRGGMVPPGLPHDPEALTRAVAVHLGGPPSARSRIDGPEEP